MKILFVSSGNSLFGISPHIKSQSNSLRKIGLEVEHYSIKGKNILNYLKNVNILAKKIKGKKYDLIHAHYSYSGLVAVLTKSRLPIVISHLGSDLLGKFNAFSLSKFHNLFLSFLLHPFVNQIICKSESLAKLVIFKNKLSIIPNGVDFNKFKPINKSVCRQRLGLNDDDKVVLFLGNPTNKIKNFVLAQKAVEMIKDRRIKFLFPYPISHSEVRYYLNACDLLIHPSFKEGSPNLVKEALACNCKVVSTNVGDVSELINGVEGSFICSFDPLDVSNKIIKSLEYRGKIDSRQKISFLRSDKIAFQISEVYGKVLRKI